MPLVVMCGFPSSGKTTRTEELKKIISNYNPNIKVLTCDDGLIDRNEVYMERKHEIMNRGLLKSVVERDLTNDNVVIVDALNYVKGFRYELHCVAKYARSSYCVVHCDASFQNIVNFNATKPQDEMYSDEVLQALVNRFEPPNSMARWDSPLFVVQVGDDLPGSEIMQVLFENKKQKPNLSTQNPPLMSPTFVHDADRMIQVIAAAILSAQKTSAIGDTVSLPDTDDTYTINQKLSIAEMRRQRKQFLTFLRANPVSDISEIPKTFLYFLSSF